MVDELTRSFITSLNRNNFTCNFPDLLIDDLIKKDSKFEMSKSTTLQTLKLQYNHNIVSGSTAIIFVTTKLVRPNLEPIIYGNIDNLTEKTEIIFRDYLKFDNVEIFKDFSKTDIINKLNEL